MAWVEVYGGQRSLAFELTTAIKTNKREGDRTDLALEKSSGMLGSLSNNDDDRNDDFEKKKKV